MDYRVTAEAIDSKCSFVRAGDRIVIEGTMIDLERSTAVCAVALSAIQYSLFMMGKADDPRNYGRDNVYTLQCPDPEERVVFQITREAV